MPIHNFMLQDVLGSLVSVLVFAVVLYAPGYLIAYAGDLFGFRHMVFKERSIWAIACSFSAVPILTHLSARIAGLNGLCWLLGLSALSASFLIWRTRERNTWSHSDRRTTLLVGGGWIAFVLLMLIDLQTHHKLFFSVVMADQSYRIAFTDAVVRTGVPPANPLYFSGTASPMPYYYFWYVLCAAVVKLAHVSARQAFIASSIWAGFGLLATLGLYTRHFFCWERGQRWIAAALLLITGADLLPSVGNAVLQSSLNGDIEWWSVDPIDAWPDSLLWVPHHVASVLCCLLCFLFLWRTREPLTRSAKRWAILMAALAFASSFGLSVYVAFGFALMMLAWALRLAILRDPDRYALWLRVVMTSLVSAALLMPFLLELASGRANAAKAGAAPATRLFSFSVRRMIDSGLLIDLPLFTALKQTHPFLLDQAIRLLLLLPGLAMELGVYGVVLVLVLRSKKLRQECNEARNTTVFFTVCGLILTMFLSSAVITNNDFGYRAVMLPQFFLLLLTAEVLGSWWLGGSPPTIIPTLSRRRLVYSVLCLGATGTLYGALLLRGWLPWVSRSPQTGFSHLSEDAFQMREAFATLDKIAPADAVIAFPLIDPTIHRGEEVVTPEEFYQRILVMDSGRQILNAEWKCAIHFGGDPTACPEIRRETSALYAAPAPSRAWAEGFCRQFGVQYLAVSYRDAIWNSPTGWPASLPVIAHEPGFELLGCNRPQ